MENGGGGGGTNVDFAYGAFTGTDGLPASISSETDWFSYSQALWAKTSERYDGGVSVTNFFARYFTGVGGGGADHFDVASQVSSAIRGEGGDDTLSGSVGNDSLYGGAADDLVAGQGGRDNIFGGDGDDTLDGGFEQDTVNGGDGADHMDGAFGNDTASYEGAQLGVTVSLAITTAQNTKGAGADTLTGFENLLGGFGDDRLTGDGAANLLAGADGNDVLVGGLGGDTLDGGLGVDTADYRALAAGVTVSTAIEGSQITGGAGEQVLVSIENLLGTRENDSLTGDQGNNQLDGGGGKDAIAGDAGYDLLSGGGGRDLITGGAGADTMTGGVSKDRFVYYSVADSVRSAPDLITDLSAEDRIDLSAIDAKLDKDGDQAFSLVTAFTHKSGQASLAYDSATDLTRLALDVNGDGKADGFITIAGDHSDFVNFVL